MSFSQNYNTDQTEPAYIRLKIWGAFCQVALSSIQTLTENAEIRP